MVFQTQAANRGIYGGRPICRRSAWIARTAGFGCALLVMLVMAGCTYDSGANVLSTSGTTPTNPEAVRTQLARYTMPSELSAVPATSVGNTPSGLEEPKDLLHAAADPGTDYTNTDTRTYVEERTLDQFTRLEKILKAIDQTQYEKEIGQGAYKALVAIEEEKEGRTQKKLETWTVQSEAITTDGTAPYLRVRAWIEKTFAPGMPVIKAEFKIYSPPTRNSDGTYQDYGQWLMNVKLDDIGDEDYFVAACEAGTNGFAKIRLYEKLSGQGQISEAGLDTKVKAVLFRSATQGYGKIYHPDFAAYFCPDCDQTQGVPHKTAVYAYNENHLAVQEDEDGEVIYKDRNEKIMITQRYGVFHAESGEDVLKTKSFGFPVRYTENGIDKQAYYGAWQGRHNLWTPDEGTIAEGTKVYRDDIPPDQPIEEYTVGKTFNGVLVKRSYQEAEMDDIRNMPVEVLINRDYNLFFHNDAWLYCAQMDWSADPPVCSSGDFVDFDAAVGLNTLITTADNFMKRVSIHGWDEVADKEKAFVYEAAALINRNQAGFYEAEEVTGRFGPVFRPLTPRVPIDTRRVRGLWVNVSGSIFVEYKGASGWFEKKVDYFDEFTWTPKFDPAGDRSFNLPDGIELYVNMQGNGYIVSKENGVTSVKSEIQTVCNPTNVLSILPDGAGTVFHSQWNPEVDSTYRFVTEPADPKYMQLVYRSIGDNDKDQNGNPLVAVGDTAPSMWGIEATINGATVGFNWEYDATSRANAVSFLMEGNNYKLLDDSMRFDPISVTNAAGRTKTLYLGFDGWMSGLPDLYSELEKSEWVITTAIRDKIINLPAGTELTETATNIKYLIKPLERSIFLAEITDPGDLNLTAAKAVSLSDIPIYTEHGMGDAPEVATISYSEGNPVE